MSAFRRAMTLFVVIAAVAMAAGVGIVLADVFATAAAQTRRVELVITARQLAASAAVQIQRAPSRSNAIADAPPRELDVSHLLPPGRTGRVLVRRVRTTPSAATLRIEAIAGAGRLTERCVLELPVLPSD
ncbi:MAG: hypothetical protein L6Q92_06130 [Phycisphaerae bacterium]|nr:hypothetical protein [Phycisphaerae bacterium]